MWSAVQADGPERRLYQGMRLAIGGLGLLLPPLIVGLEPLLFDGQPAPRGSLSAYYYSGLREVFVGGVCAIGVFLFTYQLARATLENVLSMIAGAAAVAVAVFPTQRPGTGFPLTPLQELLDEDTVRFIHFSAAVIFIGLLAVLGVFFALYGYRWRWFHIGCAAAIVAAAGLALYAAKTGGPDKALLYAEWGAVWAFSASWAAAVWSRAG